MSDNTTLNPGAAGDVIGTDDISGVKYQVIKNAFGPDGAITRVTASVGLPVDLTATGSNTNALKVDGSAVTQPVSIAGTISVNTPQSLPSTNNSSTATLTSGSTFTGTADDCINYSEIRITVFTDQVSATDGLSIQQSSNSTNWDITDTYTIAASTGKTFVVPRQARYFRVVYTNGGTNQTVFRLQTILNKTGTTPSSQRSSDTYSNENDLQEVWSFNSLFNGTTWDRMRGDTNGAQIQGAAAQGASVTGKPVLVAGEGRKTLGTPVSDGQVIRQMLDAYGMTVVVAFPTSHVSSNGTPIAATTTSVIAAPSAGTHIRVLRMHMSNGGATSTWVAIRDGAAGTQYYRTFLPQNGVVSLNLNLSGPLELTSATRLDIVLSAAGSVEYQLDYLIVAD